MDRIQGMSSQSLDSLLLLPGKLYQGRNPWCGFVNTDK